MSAPDAAAGRRYARVASVVRIRCRARQFLGFSARRADQQPPPARRVTRPRRIERSGNDHLRDAGRARLDVIDAVCGAGMTADDRRSADRMRTGSDSHPRRATSLKCDSDAIDRHVKIVGARAGCRRPSEPCAARLCDLQLVLRIERKRVPHEDAAPGAQGQAVHVVILRDVAGHAIGDAVDSDRWIAERQPADPGRRRRIALDERR